MDKQNKALFRAIFTMLGLMWGIFLIDMIVPGSFNGWLGVHPRSITGIFGIVTFSFAHGGWMHILSNSVPFFMLSILVAYSVGLRGVAIVWLIGGLGSGLGIWVFSSAGVVVGASGIVFALIGFIFGRIYYEPTVQNGMLALIAFFMYSGALYSLFSVQEGISWVGHVSGLIAGVTSSTILLSKR